MKTKDRNETNTIKKGYKQTEVGVIPEDWDLKKLKDFCDVRDGTHESPKYYENGVKFITSKNITRGRIDFSDVSYISNEMAFEIDKRSKVNKDDILISMIGTIGELAYIYDEPDFCIKNIGLIKPNKNDVFNKLLYYSIENPKYQNYIKKTLDGGIQKFISLGVLRNLPIPLPPTLEEQEKIATALSDTDAYIEKLEAILQKKKFIKQGAMQELLTGKTRLVGKTKGKKIDFRELKNSNQKLPSGYKQTEVGVVPEDWVVRKLGDVTTIKMGQSPLSRYYNISGVGLPLIQGNADLKNRQTIQRNFTSIITKKGYKNDIIMSVRAPVGEIAVATFDCCLGRGVCSFSYINQYLFHYMIYRENSWSIFSSGSTFDSVNSDKIKAFPLAFPPTLEEQEKIAEVLSDMDAEIEKLESKIQKYKDIKKGMMQKLLTGQVRLV